MAETRCKKCLLDENSGTLYRSVQELIAALPEERRTPPEEYARRLALCRTCEKLQNGMCRYCGCFVQLRAAKKGQRCPAVKGKW